MSPCVSSVDKLFQPSPDGILRLTWTALQASEAQDHDFVVCRIFCMVKKYELIKLIITYHNYTKLQNLFHLEQVPYVKWGTWLKNSMGEM